MMTSTSHDVSGNDVKDGNDFGVKLDDSIVLSSFNNTRVLKDEKSQGKKSNFKA